jgi:hypothetical protein
MKKTTVHLHARRTKHGGTIVHQHPRVVKASKRDRWKTYDYDGNKDDMRTKFDWADKRLEAQNAGDPEFEERPERRNVVRSRSVDPWGIDPWEGNPSKRLRDEPRKILYVAKNDDFLKAGRNLMERGEIGVDDYGEMLRRSKEARTLPPPPPAFGGKFEIAFDEKGRPSGIKKRG